MKRAFLIFSLVLATALAGCNSNDDPNDPAPIEETGGGTGGETGGETGGMDGSASTILNSIAYYSHT